jgi:transposase-like protein
MTRANIGSETALERGRWSSRRKTEVVLCVLRGEALDALSRELGVTAATLAQWRDQFLAAGGAGVRSRPTDACDEDLARLRAKIGELTLVAA